MKNKLKVLLSLLAVCSVLGATTACGLFTMDDSTNSESSSVSESINESSEDMSSDAASDSMSDSSVVAPTTYTVTFMADGEEVGTATYTEDNTEITEPTVPTKEHYTGVWEAYELTTGDITVNAVYTAVEYAITFVADGEEVGKVTYTVEDTEIEEPAVPEKDYYVGVWEEYTLDCGNKTVNAEYTYVGYTVKFVDEDGVEISTGEYELGDEVIVPADPVKEADDEYTYIFAGWDKDVTLVEGSATYTATYIKTPITYTITFKANGEEVAVKEYNVENKEIEVPAVPEKAHYTGVWETYELTTGNVVVNAVYTPVNYTVTFMNGEEVVDTVTFNIEGNDKTAPAIPEKTGYTGVWSKYDFSKFENQTVSLDYTANEYTITYIANGGSVENAEQTVVYDDAYTLAIATASKFYQEFLGWQDEEGNVLAMEGDWTIDSNVTLTAQYSNVITFDSMTEVPSYLQNGGRASLAIVDGNGGKVLQATSEKNDQGNVRIMMPLTYMAEFFEDPKVQYMAFDLKLPEGATTPVSSIMYHNLDQTNYTSYETGDPGKAGSQFDTTPTDAFKSYYLPRSVYEAWVAGGKTEGRFLNVQAGITQGASYWIDNIRPVTADDYTADLFSFETGSLRTNMGHEPGFCEPNYNQFQLKFTNVDETTAKFTNEIVSDGMRAITFKKYSGDTAIMFNQNTDTPMETAMRQGGYIAFDLYVPEGSDAKIVRAGQTWYGELKQGWNTVYEQVSATENEIIRFTDTTASTYVIDNFRLLTEDEYNAAKFGFEIGGVIRHNNSDTTSAGWSYYYVGWDKANNKASIQVNEGNGENDVATLSNVRFDSENAHGGNYSLAFDKNAGYMSLGMSSESAMYASLKNGFTFWIYSTVAMDGEGDSQFINGLNSKLNGGEGIMIEANTWTQVTVSAEDIHATGRFLILQGSTAGTIYIDDIQPLPATEVE